MSQLSQDPGVLDFRSIRTSADRLNFGEDDLDDLAVYYQILPFPLYRYEKVLIRFRLEPYEEYQNIPRNTRLTFKKNGKTVLRVLSPTIKNGEVYVEHFLQIPRDRRKDYDEVRLEFLVEKFTEGDLRFSDLKVFLGEEFIK